KTWVYLEAIAHARACGLGALALVPEIALTPQLAGRFRARFGEDVAVLHSGLSDAERVAEWHRVRDGRAGIVGGARSAGWAPIERLGIVVVDEEHEPSYKQEERLRYHARDLALVRAQRARAVAVLGSATPSLETLRRAQEGKLRTLRLPERVEARPQPPIVMVKRRVSDELLTAELSAALRDTLGRGEQAILFLNRRGHTRTLLCAACGAAVGCPNFRASPWSACWMRTVPSTSPISALRRDASSSSSRWPGGPGAGCRRDACWCKPSSPTRSPSITRPSPRRSCVAARRCASLRSSGSPRPGPPALGGRAPAPRAGGP